MVQTRTTDVSEASAALERALKSFADKTFHDFSRFRWAEEREWYEAALFYQRRQWLSWDGEGRRWKQIKQDSKRPRPMPVSNYFAMTINANANQLAARLPRMQASPLSDDDRDRRAADMAEKAIPAVDKESGMAVMNPLLAKHTVLWGMGVTKDIFDASLSTGRTRVPKLEVSRTKMVGCLDCGGSYDVPAAPGGTAAGGDGQRETCPQCGSHTIVPYEKACAQATGSNSYGRGRLVTEVRPIFEVFLPRDCQNPNLAKRICQRYRKPIGELRRMFPDEAEEIQADATTEVNEVYLEALRSIVAYSWLNEQTAQCATVTEVWADWDELTEDVQDAIEEECDADDVEQWQALGGFIITAGGKLLDYGPNPLDGKNPFTFYLWEVDPANVYPKGLSIDLIPLQKRLNRIDSLMELSMMCNAAGKWLFPKTQTTKPPTGSPNDVIEYDVVGDGKIAPSFVQPSPLHESAWTFRQTILQDFQQLGMTQGAGRGEAPANVSSFRGLAYLGAKAGEQLSTQRFLYELGHQLRYEKCLLMAEKFWDEPRLVKVAGPNGRYMVRSFIGEELAGNYEIELIPDSSKPRSLEEKQQAFAWLLQSGMVDVRDPSTRDYVLDMANLEDVALSDSLQYLKAQRDLERAKQGIAPADSPFLKFDVFLKIFVDFTLTEEFEELDPQAQQVIIAAAQNWSAKLTEIQQQQQQALAARKKPSETINFKDAAAFSPAAGVEMLEQAGLTPSAPGTQSAPAPVLAGHLAQAAALGKAMTSADREFGRTVGHAAARTALGGSTPGTGPSAAAVERAAVGQGAQVATAMA